MATPGSFVAGTPLTAAEMNQLPAGKITACTPVVVNQGTITTVVDLTGLSVTWTAVTGRQYRIWLDAMVFSSVAADSAEITITTSGNTVVGGKNVYCPAVNTQVDASCIAYVTGSGSVTYKGRARRAVGTGNVSLYAAATFPATLIVEDLGVA